MRIGLGAHPVTLSGRKVKPREEQLPGKSPGRPAEPAALQFAYRLLAYRGRSEKEMRDRLSLKGFDEPAISAVISDLLSLGFLDDRRLAASLKRYAGETRHLGVRGTRRFLRERGIPEPIIEETLADIDEADLARKAIQKKMKALGQYPKEKMLRRLYGHLTRRGYTTETIRKALSSLAPDESLL